MKPTTTINDRIIMEVALEKIGTLMTMFVKIMLITVMIPNGRYISILILERLASVMIAV
jgi:hypothetical protein